MTDFNDLNKSLGIKADDLHLFGLAYVDGAIVPLTPDPDPKD